jgi:hypothetical protein
MPKSTILPIIFANCSLDHGKMETSEVDCPSSEVTNLSLGRRKMYLSDWLDVNLDMDCMKEQ